MTDTTNPAAFTELVNLAARTLGAGVVAANDELFAEKENLIVAAAAEFRPHTFGHKGQIMDGWETRRRRGAGADEPHPTDFDHDWAIVRLGVAGVVRGVVVDTAHFTGNYPETASVEAASVPGTPSPEELARAEWTELVPRTTLRGDTAHEFGGVATGASDRYFSSPHNLNALGRAVVMGEGWETRRRRNKDNDWVELKLAGTGEVLAVEVDTTHFVANCPGWASVSGRDESGEWFDLLPRTRLQPDTRHRVRVAPQRPVTLARLNVFPDGGVARLRLTGRLTEAGRAALALRWLNLVPAAEAEQALAEAGLTASEAASVAAARPLADGASVKAAVDALQPHDTPDGEDTTRRGAAIWRLLGV